MAGGATEQLPARGGRHDSEQRDADLKSSHRHAIKESVPDPRGGSSHEPDGKPDSPVSEVQTSLTGEHLSSQRELSAIAECVSPVTTPGTQKGETSPRGSSAGSPRDSGNHSLTGEDHSETADAPTLEEAEAEAAEQESKGGVPEQSLVAESDVTEPAGTYHKEVSDKGQLFPVEAGPEATGVQEAPEEEMSGNMQIMRPAETLEDVTAAHHDTRSLSLEHVIVGKLEGEPQIEKDSDAINSEYAEPAVPTAILAKDINSHQGNAKDKKDEKQAKPPVPDSKPKKNDVKQGSRVASETAPSKKTSRAGTAQEGRASKPPPSDRSRAESKTLKKQESTRSLKKPTQIKQKPRSSSQEELRPPLKHRHSSHFSNQQGPPEKSGLLQKSSSLANIPRNSSAMMGDLHVYLVPHEKWSAPRQLAEKATRNDTISLGFVRAHPDSTLSLLRREISAQLLGNELALRHYKFVRPVGKHFAQVKAKQESHLKARNFMPPYTSDPEIHLLRLLPHDPLEETEDAAYWRAWDRALRLDRDFPVVRNTSSPRAPPATRQHWPQELLLVKKYRASPTNYVLDTAGRLHAVEVADRNEEANEEEYGSFRRHRRASVPDRLTNHHYHRTFDREGFQHLQNQSITADGELDLKDNHYSDRRHAKGTFEGSHILNSDRINTYQERDGHNQTRASDHNSSSKFDDFDDRGGRRSPADDGQDTERRFLRSRRVQRRHRSPDDRLAASSDEWSPRELREARQSRRARRSAAQRPRRPPTDPPPEAPVSDDSDDSSVLFIDNGRIVESEHADSPPPVLPNEGTANRAASSPAASPPAPRPPRAVLEYARLERPKRPGTLHPRRRRRSPGTRVSPGTETSTKVASTTGKTSARTPSRIPRPQLSETSTRVRGRRGARPAVSSTSDTITDVLVIDHPAEAENMDGNSGPAMVQIREKGRGVTETGGGAHEDREAPPAIIFHDRVVRTSDVGNGGGNDSGSTAASPKKGEISAPDSGVASSAASASTGRYIPRRRRSQYSYRDQVSHVMQDISDIGAEDDPFSTEYRDMYKKKEAEKRLKLVQPDTEIYDRSAFEKDTSYQTQYVTHSDDEYRMRSGLRPGTSDLMPKGDFDDGGHGSRHHSELSESGAERTDLGGSGGDQAAGRGAENTGDDVFAQAGDDKAAEHDNSLGLSERGGKSHSGSMSADDENIGKGASSATDAWTDKSAHEGTSSRVEKTTESNNSGVSDGDTEKGASTKDGNDDLLKPEHADTDTEKGRRSRDKTKRVDKKRQKSKGRNKSKGRDKSTQRDKPSAKLDAQSAEERKRTRSKSRDGSKRSKSNSRARDGKVKASDSSTTAKLTKAEDNSKESEDDLLNLRKKLTEAKQRRAENEHRRDELVLLSRSLQEQLSIKRDEDMQKWRELYLQERKLTGPLEEACSTLRRDIEKMHKKLLQRVETRHKGTGKEGPSRKLTMKINSKRLESDIADWKRRVQAAQLILDTETKLRQAAEKDVKDLRQELSQKRVSVTQARSQYGLDAVDWYLLLGRQKAAQRGPSGRSSSQQNQPDGDAEPQPA